MEYIARLSWGEDYLELSSSLSGGRYDLVDGFTPPRGGDSVEFMLKIIGASAAEVQRGKDEVQFFLMQGTPDKPVYFEWRESLYIPVEPLLGQRGANKRTMVLDWELGWWDEYTTYDIRKKAAMLLVTLKNGTVRGKRNKLARAKGGVYQDFVGVTTARSRGVHVCPADATNGNKFTNPIFGHPTSWSTNWLSGVRATENKSSQYKLFGQTSARLTSESGTTGYYFQRIDFTGNTSTHILSFFAKALNSGEIDDTICEVYYNGLARASTYDSLGDGWFRVWASVTGSNIANTECGIIIYNNQTLFVDGFQMEQNTTITPFFYGDMPGCSWSGVPHETKSLRAASYLRHLYYDLVSHDTGTLRVAWRADKPSSSFSATNGTLIVADGTPGQVWLYYNNGYWKFQYNGTTIQIADTFSAGDRRLLYISWSSNGINLVVNGTYATGAYDFTYLTDYIYIGTNTAFASHIGGTIYGLAAWDYGASQPQLLNDYNDNWQLVQDDYSLDPIAYAWSTAGDSNVGNADDATYTNYMIIAGIQGDLPALVEAKLQSTSINDADVYLSLLPMDYNAFINPEFLSYIPAAPPDAVSIGTADTTIATIPLDADEFRLLQGKYFCVMLRADEDNTGNNLSLRTGVNLGSGTVYYSEYEVSNWRVTSTDKSIDTSPAAGLPVNFEIFDVIGLASTPSIVVQGKRASGGALTFNLHYAQILPYPITRLANLAAGAKNLRVLYFDGNAWELTTTDLRYYTYGVRGDKILRFTPEKYNVLLSFMGKEGVLSEASYVMYYFSVYYTPQWSGM